jgi:acyl carrier protein
VPRRRSGTVPTADQALAGLSAAAVDRFSGESRAIGSSTFDQTRDLRQDRASFMAELDLRARIKEMLVKSLMLQVTPEQIGDDLPLFGANGLGLDSIDALELGSRWQSASNCKHNPRLHSRKTERSCLD